MRSPQLKLKYHAVCSITNIRCSLFKIVLVGTIFCIFFLTYSSRTTAYSFLDLNDNGILDVDEEEVVISSTIDLPAGEYVFNNLVLTESAHVNGKRNINTADDFKGVKISAKNIIVMEGARISADGEMIPGSNYGSGVSGDTLYYAGASYGGVGFSNIPESTYGSAVTPLDLGSDGYYQGGGAIQLLVSDTLTNNGTISARGGASASGGSVYVVTKNLTGNGLFDAGGGRLFTMGFYKGPGGGGRVAIHYESNSFTGNAYAKGGCGYYSSWTQTCADNGTVGFIDTLNNILTVYNTWRFEKNDNSVAFGRIVFTQGSSGEVAHEATIQAQDLLVTDMSKLSVQDDARILVSRINIDKESTVILSGNEEFENSDLSVLGTSTLTVLPQRILHIKTNNLVVSEGSQISVDGKGYEPSAGPGAPTSAQAGASHGGVGLYNDTETLYGSSTVPVDFGSGGARRGGGALRVIVSNLLVNNGAISANGEDSGSGGSVYITTKKIEGVGSIRANGGRLFSSGYYMGPGGGGRVMITHEDSAYAGITEAKGGCGTYNSWVNVCAEDGTVGVIEVKPVVPEDEVEVQPPTQSLPPEEVPPPLVEPVLPVISPSATGNGPIAGSFGSVYIGNSPIVVTESISIESNNTGNQPTQAFSAYTEPAVPLVGTPPGETASPVQVVSQNINEKKLPYIQLPTQTEEADNTVSSVYVPEVSVSESEAVSSPIDLPKKITGNQKYRNMTSQTALVTFSYAWDDWDWSTITYGLLLTSMALLLCMLMYTSMMFVRKTK